MQPHKISTFSLKYITYIPTPYLTPMGLRVINQRAMVAYKRINENWTQQSKSGRHIMLEWHFSFFFSQDRFDEVWLSHLELIICQWHSLCVWKIL